MFMSYMSVYTSLVANEFQFIFSIKLCWYSRIAIDKKYHSSLSSRIIFDSRLEKEVTEFVSLNQRSSWQWIESLLNRNSFSIHGYFWTHTAFNLKSKLKFVYGWWALFSLTKNYIKCLYVNNGLLYFTYKVVFTFSIHSVLIAKLCVKVCCTVTGTTMFLVYMLIRATRNFEHLVYRDRMFSQLSSSAELGVTEIESP